MFVPKEESIDPSHLDIDRTYPMGCCSLNRSTYDAGTTVVNGEPYVPDSHDLHSIFTNGLVWLLLSSRHMKQTRFFRIAVKDRVVGEKTAWFRTCCCWQKSCTNWCGKYHIIYWFHTSQVVQDFFHQQYYRNTGNFETHLDKHIFYWSGSFQTHLAGMNFRWSIYLTKKNGHISLLRVWVLSA